MAHCTLARVGHGGYQHTRATRETPARAGCYNSRDHVDNYGIRDAILNLKRTR